MSSDTSHGSSSTSTSDALSYLIIEVRTEREKTENLASSCSEQAANLKEDMDHLLTLIDDVLQLDMPDYLSDSIMEMKHLCVELGKSFDSIGSWDTRSGQTGRQLDVAKNLENSDDRDLWHWISVSGDLSHLNTDLDRIKLALEVDISKLTRITVQFEDTFVVSTYG